MESATLLKRATSTVALVALLLASPALVSATPLPIDSGTAIFNGPSFTGLTLNGYVDYAVWAPGTFPSYGNADISVSPTDQANDYVYTYQVFNNPATGPAGYTQIVPANLASEVTFLNVAVNVPVTNIGEYVPPVGISPSFDTVGQSAQWAFFNMDIEPGQNSVGLFFTSPFSYTSAASSVQDGIATNITLPTPVPEPGSLVLLGLGMLVGIPWLAQRRLRRQ